MRRSSHTQTIKGIRFAVLVLRMTAPYSFRRDWRGRLARRAERWADGRIKRRIRIPSG